MSSHGIRSGWLLGFLLPGVLGGCAGMPGPRSPGLPTLPPAVGQYSIPDQPAKSPKSAGFFGVQKASAEVAGPGEVVPADDSALLKNGDEGFQWSDLYPSHLYKDFKKTVGLGPDERLARSLYREGEDLYGQKRFKEAAAKFKSAAGRWPDSTLEEDALFYEGESQFFSDQYAKASDTYGQLLKKYDYTRHLDTVSRRFFAIGRYWEQYDQEHPSLPVTPNLVDSERPWFDTFGNAIKDYDAVRLHDPTGPLADDAVMATANAYFRKGRYEDAAYNYDLIRKEYPKSEHQVNAHLLGMKSHEMMYQGPLYDAKPLDDAGKIAGQAITQLPGQLGPERAAVIETKNRVLEEQARREWSVGQYYDRKQYYGSARLYYQSILNRYPQTETAALARTRLDQIEDLPANPTNHFKWLTDAFDQWK